LANDSGAVNHLEILLYLADKFLAVALDFLAVALDFLAVALDRRPSTTAHGHLEP
jgi:hypothetical protein